MSRVWRRLDTFERRVSRRGVQLMDRWWLVVVVLVVVLLWHETTVLP